LCLVCAYPSHIPHHCIACVCVVAVLMCVRTCAVQLQSPSLLLLSPVVCWACRGLVGGRTCHLGIISPSTAHELISVISLVLVGKSCLV
jgi:hypothetical protein